MIFKIEELVPLRLTVRENGRVLWCVPGICRHTWYPSQGRAYLAALQHNAMLRSRNV